MVDSATGSSFNDEFRGFPTAILRKADRIRHLDFSLSLSLSLLPSLSVNSGKYPDTYGALCRPRRVPRPRRATGRGVSATDGGSLRSPCHLGDSVGSGWVFFFSPFFFSRQFGPSRRPDDSLTRPSIGPPIVRRSPLVPRSGRRNGAKATPPPPPPSSSAIVHFRFFVVVVVVVVFPSSPA